VAPGAQEIASYIWHILSTSCTESEFRYAHGETRRAGKLSLCSFA